MLLQRTWLLMVIGVLLGVLSGVLGLAPLVVEPPGAANPVDCGPTWFRADGLPSECYTTTDVWAVAAKAGLATSIALVAASLALWALAARRPVAQVQR